MSDTDGIPVVGVATLSAFLAPLMTGDRRGLFTAAALPLIAQFGAPAVLGLTAILTVGWLAFGLLYFGRMVPDRGKGRWQGK